MNKHLVFHPREILGLTFSLFAVVFLSVATASAEDAVAAAGGEDGKVIATYSSGKFTAGDFEEAVREVSPRARKTLEDAERRKRFVENHLLSELIYRKGIDDGLSDDAGIRDQIDKLERRLVIQKVMSEQQASPIPEEDVRAYYDANQGEFSTERVKASHILVAEEELAIEIHGKVVADQSVFAELAKEHSVDRSNAERGGDLGFFGRNRMVKEFEDTAFAMTEDGQISEPIKTRFGYHVIMRTGREDGSVKAFEDVENQIKIRMTNERRADSTQAFLDQIKTDSALTIDDEALQALPLPERTGKDKDAARAMPAGHP
jgi:peptidyl-prolyl cis-trans isomerase C